MQRAVDKAANQALQTGKLMKSLDPDEFENRRKYNLFDLRNMYAKNALKKEMVVLQNVNAERKAKEEADNDSSNFNQK